MDYIDFHLGHYFLKMSVIISNYLDDLLQLPTMRLVTCSNNRCGMNGCKALLIVLLKSRPKR